jgi:hypothetical protein
MLIGLMHYLDVNVFGLIRRGREVIGLGCPPPLALERPPLPPPGLPVALVLYRPKEAAHVTCRHGNYHYRPASAAAMVIHHNRHRSIFNVNIDTLRHC